MNKRKARLAILDMNNKVANQGLRGIKEIAQGFDDQVDWKVYDVRGENEIPDLTYDIYICSGGPGNPLESGEWKESFFSLIDTAWKQNQRSDRKKYFFFICHSFQMACEHFELGEITRRRKTSFGVYPIHKTKAGENDTILNDLDNPFYAVDSRDWQLTQPNLEVFKEHGAEILSLEKIRTHVELERAIMAVRFSREFVGTQFHPEADPIGMREHFHSQEVKDTVIENFDEQKYIDMMEHLEDPDKIQLTHSVILPHFISDALQNIENQRLVLN